MYSCKKGKSYRSRLDAASGRPHAEVMALKQAGERAKGATAYCTLEPCAHFGKTPPCCDALIEAGISQVIVAVKDPDPRVNGQGIKRLREAGINVVENVCKENALEVMQGFFHVQKFARPFVTLKLGMSIDSATCDDCWSKQMDNR